MSSRKAPARRNAVLGIDPGRDGAVCLLSRSHGLERVQRAPLRQGGREYREADLEAMAALVRELEPRILFAVLERASSYSGGRAAAFGPFQLAERRGVWIGILACHGVEVCSPAARTWQARSIDALGTGKGAPSTKDRSRMLAVELWPKVFRGAWEDQHDGETDAAHLAAFGLEELRARAQGASLIPKARQRKRRAKRTPRTPEELREALRKPAR